GSRGAGSPPASAAQSSSHCACIILGRRWITTFSSDPTQRPRSAEAVTSAAGKSWRREKNDVIGREARGAVREKKQSRTWVRLGFDLDELRLFRGSLLAPRAPRA